MEDSCENKVKHILESNSGTVLEKLEAFKLGLKVWERGIKEKWVKSSRRLHNKLERLTDLDRDNEIFG